MTRSRWLVLTACALGAGLFVPPAVPSPALAAEVQPPIVADQALWGHELSRSPAAVLAPWLGGDLAVALQATRALGRMHDPEAVPLLEAFGHVPLPPYLPREGGDAPEDSERYQTVYAREAGAIAAPTAGLHFTEGLLERLERRGVERATVTLHVGPGTFRPVDGEEVGEHRMHSERFHLPVATVEAIEACRRRGGRVVAVGTTCVRVLESRVRPDGSLEAGEGRTELFITPGFSFGAVDVLLTNFHLPRSTLLMLVAAFAGRERILRLYEEAVVEEYRFYSYGDAMLLCR